MGAFKYVVLGSVKNKQSKLLLLTCHLLLKYIQLSWEGRKHVHVSSPKLRRQWSAPISGMLVNKHWTLPWESTSLPTCCSPVKKTVQLKQLLSKGLTITLQKLICYREDTCAQGMASMAATLKPLPPKQGVSNSSGTSIQEKMCVKEQLLQDSFFRIWRLGSFAKSYY